MNKIKSIQELRDLMDPFFTTVYATTNGEYFIFGYNRKLYDFSPLWKHHTNEADFYLVEINQQLVIIKSAHIDTTKYVRIIEPIIALRDEQKEVVVFNTENNNQKLLMTHVKNEARRAYFIEKEHAMLSSDDEFLWNVTNHAWIKFAIVDGKITEEILQMQK